MYVCVFYERESVREYERVKVCVCKRECVRVRERVCEIVIESEV